MWGDLFMSEGFGGGASPRCTPGHLDRAERVERSTLTALGGFVQHTCFL